MSMNEGDRADVRAPYLADFVPDPDVCRRRVGDSMRTRTGSLPSQSGWRRGGFSYFTATFEDLPCLCIHREAKRHAAVYFLRNLLLLWRGNGGGIECFGLASMGKGGDAVELRPPGLRRQLYHV